MADEKAASVFVKQAISAPITAAAIALAIGSVVVNYVNTQRDIDELRRGVASIREEVKADRVEHSRQMDVIVTRLTGIEKAVSGLEGKIDSLFRERR